MGEACVFLGLDKDCSSQRSAVLFSDSLPYETLSYAMFENNKWKLFY